MDSGNSGSQKGLKSVQRSGATKDIEEGSTHMIGIVTVLRTSSNKRSYPKGWNYPQTIAKGL